LIDLCESEFIAISFSNEGFLGSNPHEELISIFKKVNKKGKAKTYRKVHKRYTSRNDEFAQEQKNIESLFVFRRS
jgi:hypothetical protein